MCVCVCVLRAYARVLVVQKYRQRTERQFNNAACLHSVKELPIISLIIRKEAYLSRIANKFTVINKFSGPRKKGKLTHNVYYPGSTTIQVI